MQSNGLLGTAAEQNLGPIAVRTESYSPGGDHRQQRDCRFAAESAERTDVPHLPGHAEEDDDHQGVSASVLLRLHHYRPAIGQQGMSDVPKEARLEAIAAAGSQFRSAHLEDLSESRGVRSPSGTRAGQVQSESLAGVHGQFHYGGH